MAIRELWSKLKLSIVSIGLDVSNTSFQSIWFSYTIGTFSFSFPIARLIHRKALYTYCDLAFTIFSSSFTLFHFQCSKFITHPFFPQPSSIFKQELKTQMLYRYYKYTNFDKPLTFYIKKFFKDYMLRHFSSISLVKLHEK